MGKLYDCIIIGSGPAGLTAAIYAARACLSVLVLEKEFVSGGQVVNTYEVDNYPGYRGISGFDLGMKFREHAEKLDVEFVMEAVERVDLEKEEKIIYTDQSEYHGRTVILAMGASHRKLEVRGEEDFSGMGVSYCATCDGAFFRGKAAAVIGGGNTALEDALFLSNLCESVFLIHRRNAFRGEKLLADAVKKRKNIIFHGETVVKEILGEKAVTAAVIRNINSGQEELLPVSAVFIAIGLVPDNRIFSELPLDSNGYILAGDDCKTSLAGVFAAGDTRAKALRQILTAASDGATAAFQAASYVNTLETALR